ncbi:MAG: alpha/beta fold hydrolase [Acidobacteria bacterium]|nr:alpha/beta fold hydrolase [Acidobacteriota bacterium]
MPTSTWIAAVLTLAGAGVVLSAQATAPPADPNRRLLPLANFRLESGAVLPVAQVAYATFGTLNAAKDNAVLVPSYYGADYHGYDFLIGPGKALDPSRFFIVATEMFGNGNSSSPSNTASPMSGPDFPAIAIRDNVEASRRVLAHLGVTHVRAVVGFSMGAEQAFQWAVSHPTFMDGIVPWCGTAKTYPHGVVRLESAIRALTADPAFNNGRYTTPPKAGMAAWSTHWAAWVWSQEWWRRELFKPQSATVEEALAARIARDAVRDPNNLILHARTWQRHNVGDTPGFGGDHEKALRAITAKVLYMPCETDLYFPIGDARYEQQFLANSTFTPIPSLWGHSAGGGGNPADAAFINEQIARFLAR